MKAYKGLASVVLALSCLAGLGQDPLVMEKLNRLAGQVEDLQTAQMAMQKQISELVRELDVLRDQVSKAPSADTIRAEVSRMEARLKQVEQQCAADRELILKEIEKIAAAKSRPVQPSQPQRPAQASPSQPTEMKGYEYVVQPGDTLSAIIAAYRQNNIKVTVEQVLKANPGLDPNKLRVGQKIFIPAPSN